VMDLLGHSTIRLTADTDGHVLPTRARTQLKICYPRSDPVETKRIELSTPALQIRTSVFGDVCRGL